MYIIFSRSSIDFDHIFKLNSNGLGINIYPAIIIINLQTNTVNNMNNYYLLLCN